MLTCHTCNLRFEGWNELVDHRAEVHPLDFANGWPFWMLEERLSDKEYAILWMNSSKAARKDLGPHNHRCWGPDIIGA